MSVPITPSNRHLYETMIAWGWVPGKSKDGHIEMVLLDHPDGMLKTTIAQPLHHKTTQQIVIKGIVRATSGGDRDKFWNHPPTKPKIDVKVESTPAPAPTPERAVLARGVSREVLTVLMQRSAPMTATDLQKVLPRFSVQSIANACGYLVSTGNAERLVRGMYKATLRNTPGQTVHHDVQGGVRHDTPAPTALTLKDVERGMEVLARSAPDTQQTSAAKEMAAVAKPSTPEREHRPLTEAQEDETLNTLLDLLFPTGLPSFQYLPAIEKWKTSTRKLMREVGR